MAKPAKASATPVPVMPAPTAAANAAVRQLAEALSAVIREAVFDAFTELEAGMRNSAEPAPALLTVDQLCAAVQTSRATLHRLRSEGLPTIMLLDSPRLRLADVVAWLEARTADRAIAAE